MSDCSTNAFKVPNKPGLKECPFCGSTDMTMGYVHRRSFGAWVKCEECEASGPVVWVIKKDEYLDAHDRARRLWNERYEPTCRFVDGGPSFAYCCDQCGYETNYYEYFTYCPGCGARVEVVD